MANNNKHGMDCLVKNRSASMVVYKIPEEGIRREFAPGEVKKVKYSELEKLSYQPGGRTLMRNFLQITNDKVVENLNLNPENEYYMSEEQIIDLLKNGSLDAFLDCLDFAPIGVIDLIKKYALSLPLMDITKREKLKEKTGFDTDAALKNAAEEKEAEGEEAKPTATTTTRRANTNYKIIEPKETETK